MKTIFLVPIIILGLISCNQNYLSSNNGNTDLSVADSAQLSKQIQGLKTTLTENDDSLILLSENILKNYPNNKTKVSIMIGHALYSKGEMNLTKHFFTIAADEYKIQKKEVLYAEQLLNIGVLNELTGDYAKAIDIYFEVLKIFEKNELYMKSSSAYHNLGIAYQKLGNKDKSIKYYKKALSISQKMGEELISASHLKNIATAFDEFKNDKDSALYYYNKAYEIYAKNPKELVLPIIESNVANIYIKQKEYKKAEQLLDRALDRSMSNNNERALILIHKFKAILFLKQGNFKDCEIFANLIIKKARIESMKERELEGLEILTNCYEKQGEYKKAMESLKTYNILKKELLGIQQKKELALNP